MRLGWRERVMGAWLSVTRDSEIVANEVLRQLEGSHGSLDAPPLAAAGVTLTGPGSLASLAKYYEADVASDWGSAVVILEAAQFLQYRFGVPNPLPSLAEGTHPAFDTLLAVADIIRGR